MSKKEILERIIADYQCTAAFTQHSGCRTEYMELQQHFDDLAQVFEVYEEMRKFVEKCAIGFGDDYPALRESALQLLAKARGGK